MLLNLGEISPVFCSLVDGSFWESIETFSDDQLRSFLPFLVSTAFQQGEGGTSEDSLLARLSTFAEGNRIAQLLSINFDAFEAEVDVKFESCEYQLADDVTKLKLLVQFFRDESKDDSNSSNFISEDILADVSLLLTLAYLHMPSLFPFERLTGKMLSMPLGPSLLTSLILNSPELLSPVLSVLMGLQVSDECSRGRQKAVLLKNLFTLCPSVRNDTLSVMTESKRDCLLAARLACAQLPDDKFVDFLLPLLLNKTSQLAQMITRSSARSTLTSLHERLIKLIKILSKTTPFETLTGLLLCVTTLQLHCVQKFSTEHISIICDFIVRKDIGNDAHMVVALASLVAIPSFTTPQHQAGIHHVVDNRIVDWLHWLKKVTMENQKSSLTQSLHYTCVCLSGQRSENLKGFLAEVLKCKITLNVRHSSSLRTLFANSCIGDLELTQRCASQSETERLSACSRGRLPIHSVFELLLSESFYKHQIDISPWMERQISSTSLPMHYLLPETVERFAIESARNQQAGLSVQFVQSVFSGDLLDESKLSLRILVLLFLLAYRSQLDQMGSKAKNIHGDDIYSHAPVRFLLSVVECRGDDFECAKKSLTRLTTDLFPYMLPTFDSIIVAKSKNNCVAMRSSVEQELSKIKNGQMSQFVIRLEQASLSDQVRFLPCIISCYMNSLDIVNTPKPLIDSIAALWTQLESVIPRMLYESSALAWLERLTKTNELTLADIYDYPAAIFRCDRRIMFSPRHFQCFLSALVYFVAANKNNLMRSIHAANSSNSKNSTEADRVDRDALSVALDHTQESLLVQLLVEVGDSRRMKDDPSDASAVGRRRAVQKIANEYIHQLFIQDKNVLKLTLFQTLPVHTLPALVEGVPSMFVAIDFIQEMLSLPDINRRVFAIALMVSIAKKYRIASSCVTTELVLDVLHTLLKLGDTCMTIQLVLRIVPTLCQIFSIFPQLTADVTQFLLQASELAKGRLALHPFVSSLGSPEKELIGLIQRSLSAQVSTEKT